VPELVVTRLSVTESTVTTTSLVVVAAAAAAVVLLVGVIVLMSWLPAAGVLLASDCTEAGRAVADGGASKTYFWDAVGVTGLWTARADCSVTWPGFAC